MAFEQSIIIPLDMFKKCQFASDSKTEEILLDTSLPTDVKMKLYNQEKAFEKKAPSPETADESTKQRDFGFITCTVPFFISAFLISAETRVFQHRVCPTCQNIISAITNSAGAAVGTPCQNASLLFFFVSIFLFFGL